MEADYHVEVFLGQGIGEQVGAQESDVRTAEVALSVFYGFGQEIDAPDFFRLLGVDESSETAAAGGVQDGLIPDKGGRESIPGERVELYPVRFYRFKYESLAAVEFRTTSLILWWKLLFQHPRASDGYVEGLKCNYLPLCSY